ncbi:hypothetical protein Syun_014346 [Stephania yunnanensis]|uniref:Uncharacterized protein n=1 Tax=Stephania yunnanensis TaxID=152371 RepID=A0AAP0JK85_9MAGN
MSPKQEESTGGSKEKEFGEIEIERITIEQRKVDPSFASDVVRNECVVTPSSMS